MTGKAVLHHIKIIPTKEHVKIASKCFLLNNQWEIHQREVELETIEQVKILLISSMLSL